MAAKWGRTYTLKIDTTAMQGGSPVDAILEIKYPLTLEFNVVRHNLASVNTASFTIYNLNEATRRRIFKDQYDVTSHRPIELYAGYSDGQNPPALLARVFKGEIRSAYSVRQGPNWKTEIECYDGGTAMSNGFISSTSTAGTPQMKTINDLMDQLPNIDGKNISPGWLDQAKRAVTMFGNPAEILKQITNGGFYIDSQQAYALQPNDTIPGDVVLISPDTGLLDTPKRTETSVEVSLLFEPRIRPSQAIELQSDTFPIVNGIYKVVGITHRGIISGSQDGECRTSVTLWTGEGKVFREVPFGI